MAKKDELHKSFQLDRRKTVVNLSEDIKIDLWSPTYKIASSANEYLVERFRYWKKEKGDFIQGIVDFSKQFIDKKEIIERILKDTIPQEVFKSQFDLLDDKVNRKFYFDFVNDKNIAKLKKDYGQGRIIAKNQIEDYIETHKTDFNIDDFCKMFEKKEELRKNMDAYLEENIRIRYEEKEKAEYGQKSIEELRGILTEVNITNVATLKASEEHIIYLLSRTCREHMEGENEMGKLIYSDNDKDSNYIGNLSQPIMTKLTVALNDFISLEKTEAVRRRAEKANFT